MFENPENALGQVQTALRKINDEADKLDVEPIVIEPPGKTDSRQNGKNGNRCAGECICKIKKALGLIVAEIIQIDATIRLAAQSGCHYTPEPDDKRAFANSVEKNSRMCHVIIDELKKQRRDIKGMLELYKESSVEFSKLELTVERQRENIRRMEIILESATNTLNHVEIDIKKRYESFILELKSLRAREETRKEILQVVINWITSLDEKRLDKREAANYAVKEAIEQTNNDRIVLTTALRQLQEVDRIERLLVTQRSAHRENCTQ